MAISRRDFGRSVLAGIAATTSVGAGACNSSGETGGSGGQVGRGVSGGSSATFDTIEQVPTTGMLLALADPDALGQLIV